MTCRSGGRVSRRYRPTLFPDRAAGAWAPADRKIRALKSKLAPARWRTFGVIFAVTACEALLYRSLSVMSCPTRPIWGPASGKKSAGSYASKKRGACDVSVWPTVRALFTPHFLRKLFQPVGKRPVKSPNTHTVVRKTNKNSTIHLCWREFVGLLWGLIAKCGILMPQIRYSHNLRERRVCLPGSLQSHGFFEGSGVVRGTRWCAEQQDPISNRAKIAAPVVKNAPSSVGWDLRRVHSQLLLH